MNEPIKAGDSAIIIRGALADKSPNIGKQVTVGKLKGEHTQYGRVWVVYGEQLITEYGVVGTQLDCPAAWLQKTPALRVKDKQKKVAQ